MIGLCVRPNNLGEKVIPFSKYGLMDKCEWCLTLKNMEVLCNMFTKNWAILRFIKLIICSKHNIDGKGCNYKFNNLFFNILCVKEFMHHLVHLHLIHNCCPSWGLVLVEFGLYRPFQLDTST
jgi:hypothetical protein